VPVRRAVRHSGEPLLHRVHLSASEIWLVQRDKLATVTGLFASLGRRGVQTLIGAPKTRISLPGVTQLPVIYVGYFVLYGVRQWPFNPPLSPKKNRAGDRLF
jgi:hypothetical protein